MTRMTAKFARSFLTALVLGGSIVTTAGVASAAGSNISSGHAPVVQADYRGHHGDRGQGRDQGRDWNRDHDRRDERGAREHRRDDRRHWLMSERDVRRSLRRQGFEDIRIVGQRGPVYIVKADGWRGLRERLVVDGRSGAIIGREPARGQGFHWSYRW
ncbi:hypothetical protein [Roseibium aestuarii]|uniref:YpeB-like protein with protease inhibitory function n=1 Tax=Roseibium aestuarii TaxID=2600299 RepID=A0ABW4K1Z0_9HYPH|nr:hypothetical protein [Roseibium aestuarii]